MCTLWKQVKLNGRILWTSSQTEFVILYMLLFVHRIDTSDAVPWLWLTLPKKKGKLIRNEPFNRISNYWCWNAFRRESSVICVRGKDTKEACCCSVKMHIDMDVLITVLCHMIILGKNQKKEKKRQRLIWFLCLIVTELFPRCHHSATVKLYIIHW